VQYYEQQAPQKKLHAIRRYADPGATGHRLGLKALEAMLHVSRETLLRRADELGVTLDIGDDHDEAIDTRSALRCTNGLVDPLLERLKQVHGVRK
jgi:hypothetical protein